jgi:putative transposase
MPKCGDLHTGRNRVVILHATWSVTKYQHPVFIAAHLDRVQQSMRDVCAAGGAPTSVLRRYIEQEDRPA